MVWTERVSMCGEKHVRMAEQWSLYAMNLLEFPHDIISKVLVEWLPLNDVGRLDSAFCSISDRTHFLELISSEGFVAKQTVIVPHMPNYLGWQVRRKVKTTGVFLNDSLADSYLLFATTIGTHTECIELWGMQSTFADLMAELAGEYRNLKRIKLVRCGNIVGIKSLLERVGSTLVEIAIHTCTFDSNAHFEKLSLPKIKSLRVTNVRDDGEFLSIFCGCPQLEELVLDRVHSTTNYCFQKMSQHTHNLRRLTLLRCYILHTCADVLNLARHCPTLTDVKLGFCSSPSDETVVAFVENCPELDSIALFGTNSFTDAALTAIATNCGPRLRCLSITNFGEENGLNALIDHCPNLRSFKASYLPAAVHRVLIRLIGSLSQLEELALQHCGLSDAILSAVASQGEKLLHLDLTSSLNYSSVGLARVALSCTNLKTFYLTCGDGGGFGTHELSEGMRMMWYHLNPKLRFNTPNWTTPPYWKR